MLRPPSRVRADARSYRVAVDAVAAGEQDAEGVCYAKYERIVIAPNLSDGTVRETVLHEALHACFHDHVIGGPFKDEDAEENAIRALTPRLLDTLRRNPRLVTFPFST